MLSGAALWACAGAGGRLYDPGQPTPAQRQALVEAERSYRQNDPAFAAQRDALARDPVTACWLTRMLVRDVLLVRERRDVGQDQVLAAAAGIRNPVEVRALEHLEAIGAAAAPTLVEDLLEHPLGDRRELGVELLGRIGLPALPALEGPLQDSEPRLRRAAVRAAAAMPFSPQTRQCLMRAAADADFGVRGEALRGLGGGGASEADLLRRSLLGDRDAFVRRAAAEALAGFRDRPTAVALIDYLERCKRELEPLGERTAQQSLQALSGGRGPRTVEAWRDWLGQWHPEAGR
jgi:hypothetical protein